MNGLRKDCDTSPSGGLMKKDWKGGGLYKDGLPPFMQKGKDEDDDAPDSEKGEAKK